jgi:hypothetical protein
MHGPYAVCMTFASGIALVCRASSFPTQSSLFNGIVSNAYVYPRMPFNYVGSDYYDDVSKYSLDLNQPCFT